MTKDKTPHLKDTKDKTPHLKETKETKDKETKGKSKLVGRVKKVIKKSRRKLGEEKFEKELQRTIEFLAQLQVKLDNSNDGRDGHKSPEKVVKKAAGNGAGRKGKGAASLINDAAPAAESVIALKAEAPSKGQ